MESTNVIVKTRGRPSMPIELKKKPNANPVPNRRVVCPHCDQMFKWNHKIRVPNVVDPNLTPRSKAKAYRTRRLETKESKESKERIIK
jgi:hypothetical protein